MIFIENRKKSKKTLGKLYPRAEIIDLTSKGDEPFIKLSPFYPHGNIPVPFSPNSFSTSVEGIWQGLKVFQDEDIDLSKFEIKNMSGLKRTVRKLGVPLGHRQGVNGILLDYISSRKQIYLPSYAWVLSNKVSDVLDILKTKAFANDLVFLDFDTNEDIENAKKPLSHASLVKKYLEKKWPNIASTRFTEPIKKKRRKSKADKSNNNFENSSNINHQEQLTLGFD